MTAPTSGGLRDRSLLEVVEAQLRREPEPSTVWEVRVARGPIALPDLEGLFELQRREGRVIVISPGFEDERGDGDAGR